MKELLVNVLSPSRSQLYITYAAYVARDLGLTVKYIYVHQPAHVPLGMPGSIGATADVSQRDTKQAMNKAKHHFELQINNLYALDPDLPLLEYITESGYAPDVIEKYCKDSRVDTLMLGSSKEYSMLPDDSGNIEVIRKVSCPVWIVPEGIAYRPFSEILYATDYHEEDLPNLKLLAGFASRFTASITAVHITAHDCFEEQVKGEGFAKLLRKETGYEMISVRVLPETKGEPVVTGLHNFALMMDADLIVFLRENRRVADRLLYGSRSEKIARETKLPVLIFNEERK